MYKSQRETSYEKKFKAKMKDNYSVTVPLNVVGNYHKIAITDIEVINPNREMEFQYFLPKYSTVHTSEKKQLGQFKVQFKDITMSNSHRYFWISASHTLFPQYIQFTDYRLICHEEGKFLKGTPDSIQYEYCDDNIKLDFGQIGLYQSKHKILHIKNIGWETVILDWLHKSEAEDELSVSYATSYEESKKIYPELKPLYFDESQGTMFMGKQDNSVRLGVFILAGSTVSLKFSVEGTINSLNGGHASDVKKHELMVTLLPGSNWKPFKVTY